MPKEIERKFLLKNDTWKNNIIDKVQIKQGYLNEDPSRAVRIRLKNKTGILTIKGKTNGLSRLEFEYEIPQSDAIELLGLCKEPIIEKTRYIVVENNLTWELDIFEGVNNGLQIAEVELTSENQTIQIPDWIGQEVSYDSKYYNMSLMKNPFKNWEK